ncbi:uncharacterized protein BJ171DRAFT_62322 [Polychytrium aggregatum]|uniref:uncharacterized protein n=1 Tax=Polychytrium aggregatum TaxID=110093 RepID=UPI0022FE4618|nr:uncharacterized protein BJ171DRAFT_62322 [Polychytrium aggregatum]KAI9205520.1 hypothetical protein BJ171DRAFT_62322 [Polychytrium aggregatum]
MMICTKLVLFVVSFLWLHLDLAAGQTTVQVSSASGANPSTTVASSAASSGTLGTTASGSTAPTSTSSPAPICDGSKLLGNVVLTSPNSSSYHYVGTSLTIAWGYSSVTDTANYPANGSWIYYQSSTQTDPRKWTFLSSVSKTDRSFLWQVPQMAAGAYTIRVVTDNQDVQNITGNLVPCYPPGFPGIGSTSLQLYQPTDVTPAPDPYPPNKSIGSRLAPFAAALVGVALIHVLVL